MTAEEKRLFVETAKSWEGYKEKASRNHMTYEWMDGNIGRANFTRFGRIADMVMTGEDKPYKDGFPWCAMFVLSCLYESKAGKVDTTREKLTPSEEGINFVNEVMGGRFFTLRHMAGVANMYRSGVYQKRIEKIPKVADLAIYIDEKGHPFHIGIVIEVRGKEFVTIEGNTRNNGTGIVADGGCVAKKTRSINRQVVFYRT